jgi:hypothetical protein
VKTAQKYLDRLVEDNVLQRIEHCGKTLYCVDQLMATYREVASLQRGYDRKSLTDALESMRSRITEWETTYDMETPGELRGSIGGLEDANKIEQRREIASEWEHLADRIPVVQAAPNEYDWADERNRLPRLMPMRLSGTPDNSVHEGLRDVLKRHPVSTNVDSIVKRYQQAKSILAVSSHRLGLSHRRCMSNDDSSVRKRSIGFITPTRIRGSIASGTETTTTQSLAHCISNTRFHSTATTATIGRGLAKQFQQKSSGRHLKGYSRSEFQRSPPMDNPVQSA